MRSSSPAVFGQVCGASLVSCWQGLALSLGTRDLNDTRSRVFSTLRSRCAALYAIFGSAGPSNQSARSVPQSPPETVAISNLLKNRKRMTASVPPA